MTMAAKLDVKTYVYPTTAQVEIQELFILLEIRKIRGKHI